MSLFRPTPEEKKRAELKREVRATMIEWILDYRAKGGLNELRAWESAHPGTPQSVYWDASLELDEQDENKWWETLERTIDGEVLKRAIGGGAND